MEDVIHLKNGDIIAVGTPLDNVLVEYWSYLFDIQTFDGDSGGEEHRKNVAKIDEMVRERTGVKITNIDWIIEDIDQLMMWRLSYVPDPDYTM